MTGLKILMELKKYGRGAEIRTPDLHNPIVARYQAALRPDCFAVCAPQGGDMIPDSGDSKYPPAGTVTD